MQEPTRVTLGPEGQVTLPAPLLAALDLRPGDRLTVALTGEGLLLQAVPRDAIDSTYGLAGELWRSLGGTAEFVRETEESWRG